MSERKLLCTLDAVEKSYDAGPYHFGPVSLSLYEGEILGLSGHNGAGKSTLLRLLAGLLRPDRGRILPEGKPAPGQVGYVPQEIALYGTLSGMDNLLFWGAVCGLPRKPAAARARWLLEQMELSEKGRVPVCAYSGGMRRRLHLATALMVTPRLLLLDEPTAGADLHSADLMLSAVRHLRGLGCSVVLVTHRPGELEQVCDRVLTLENGRLTGGSEKP